MECLITSSSATFATSCGDVVCVELNAVGPVRDNLTRWSLCSAIIQRQGKHTVAYIMSSRTE